MSLDPCSMLAAIQVRVRVRFRVRVRVRFRVRVRVRVRVRDKVRFRVRVRFRVKVRVRVWFREEAAGRHHERGRSWGGRARVEGGGRAAGRQRMGAVELGGRARSASRGGALGQQLGLAARLVRVRVSDLAVRVRVRVSDLAVRVRVRVRVRASALRLASVEPRAATTTRGCSSAWTKKGRWVSSLSGLPRRSRLRSAGRPPSLSTSTASVKRLRDRSTSRRQHRCVAIQSGNARSRLSERLSHSSEPKLRSMMGSASIRDAVRSRQRILERAASEVPVSRASADGSSSRREWLEEVLPASGLSRNA